jgi:L-amino acid N-acyltransferase YncA
MDHLISLSEGKGIWSLQAEIIRENEASISLHRGRGFREVGYRERLGRRSNDRWSDVIFLERRSERVGI